VRPHRNVSATCFKRSECVGGYMPAWSFPTSRSFPDRAIRLSGRARVSACQERSAHRVRATPMSRRKAAGTGTRPIPRAIR
jgi:hypothetical protein